MRTMMGIGMGMGREMEESEVLASIMRKGSSTMSAGHGDVHIP